jgi:hypothetical protein
MENTDTVYTAAVWFRDSGADARMLVAKTYDEAMEALQQMIDDEIESCHQICDHDYPERGDELCTEDCPECDGDCYWCFPEDEICDSGVTQTTWGEVVDNVWGNADTYERRYAGYDLDAGGVAYA